MTDLGSPAEQVRYLLSGSRVEGERAMAKVVQDGGSPCSDADVASCLSGGHPKSKPVPTKWGMRDRAQDGDGPDDDARLQSFGEGR